MGGVAVRSFASHEWQTYRALRLRALADSPDLFGSTLERELAYPDALWSERLARGASSETELPLVAEQHATPVGLAWGRIDPEDRAIARLYQMWVAPEARGLGAGRRLLERAVAWACASGARCLLLSVACGDTPAWRLYTRAGFVPDGDPEPLRPGSPVLARPMRLALGSGTIGSR
jgi:ribosomal protein S18 acetylase RimI-like enzyme